MGTLTVSDNRYIQALDLATTTPKINNNPAGSKEANSQGVSHKAVSQMGTIKNEKVNQNQRRYSIAAFSPDQVALSPPKEKEQLTPVKAMADEALEKAGQAEADAKKMGIAKAKREVIGKCLAAAGALLGFCVAIAVTLLSGGAGVPLLALAGVGFAVAGLDAVCAVADHDNKLKGKEGLAMGSDAIGNGIHFLLTKAGVSDGRAKDVAKVGSKVLNGGLTIATALTGVFAPAAGIGKLTGVAASATVAGLKPGINLAKDIASFAKDKADEKKGKLEKEQNALEIKARALNNFEQLAVSNEVNAQQQEEIRILKDRIKELEFSGDISHQHHQAASSRSQNQIDGLQGRINNQNTAIQEKDKLLQEQQKKLSEMDAQVLELQQRDAALRAQMEQLMKGKIESSNSSVEVESTSPSAEHTRL